MCSLVCGWETCVEREKNNRKEEETEQSCRLEEFVVKPPGLAVKKKNRPRSHACVDVGEREGKESGHV